MKNGKLQVGMVGAGGIARYAHMPGWQKLKDEVEIAAVAEVNKDTREAFARDFNVRLSFSEYEEMAEAAELDIVDICAPNAVHYPAAMAAFKNGKHVICEKPLAVSTREVENMIKAAVKAKKKFMTAQHQRFRTDSQAVKRLIDDGAFGEIYYAVANALRRRGVPPRPTFIKKALSGGGPLLDIGVHILDLTYWFMGCPKVHSVTGVTYEKLAHRKDVANGAAWGEWDRKIYDVEDFAAGFVRFANGASLALSSSFLANQTTLEDFSTQIFGTKAGIHWPNGQLATQKSGILQDVELRMKDLPQVQPHAEEIRAFVECVREDREVPVRPEETLEVIKMLEGIYTSAVTGREIIFRDATKKT